MNTPIPDKLYFKIGEVVSITGIKAHVLRYWEAEFGAGFRPVKSHGRQRLYRKQDIELILQLKDLLYRQGYTIAGAKKKLRSKTCDQDSANKASEAQPVLRVLQELRSDLIRLRKSLDC
ncbi:MAG: MerR family transcriptional regulator [Desulfuromonadales bacterium C00003094]|jgi:DNA-binding transcriptional MerR regulator|nr:MAG: MerR family transcriptional regulator [Desulfuromonadales bacterium C00003094]OEU72697.1 MAG: MerR family transcriptional regulator [Desulfuromonadales bacterium C00003107]